VKRDRDRNRNRNHRNRNRNHGAVAVFVGDTSMNPAVAGGGENNVEMRLSPHTF
jgi:hypothetical protein